MTILNQASDGLHSELIVVFRAVAEFGPTAFEDLVRVCSVGESARVRSVLARWTDLGLFAASEGIIRLAPSIKKRRGETLDEFTDRLPAFCRTLVLDPKNCLPLWPADGTITEEGTGRCADFVRGMSWALAQDLYSFTQTAESARAVESLEIGLQNTVGEARAFIFRNTTRWPALRAWARYLGFATGNDDAFCLDPTIAVRDALPTLFGECANLPAATFIEALGEQIPVFDGGRYRLAVEASMRQAGWQLPPSGQLSTTLSFALRRLQMQGVLDLPFKDDTGSGLALSGRGNRMLGRFTHVGLRGASQ